jgi:protein-S-isoprenylcysteine O-methyltransferase Ste14
MFLRHLVAVVVLPVSVTFFIPLWIARRYAVTFASPRGATELAVCWLGAGLAVVGSILWALALDRFVKEGRGTLAPWDPPRRLVVRGLYRYVRNPMISGVIFILFGQALFLRSGPHAGWAAAFLAINLVYIPLVEEPQLEARFGEEYRTYRKHVPRLVPRLRPWSPD